MITLATFRSTRPEFAKAPDALVEAELANAEASIDPVRYGANENEAHAVLTCHLLAASPFGAFSRLDPKQIKANDGATTTYEVRFRYLETTAAALIRTF